MEVIMKVTNQWTEVPLSTSTTFTTIQNTGGYRIEIKLDDATPTDNSNAYLLESLKSLTYDHSSDTRKMYARCTYLKDGKETNLTVS
jgi:hypothetical protein